MMNNAYIDLVCKIRGYNSLRRLMRKYEDSYKTDLIKTMYTGDLTAVDLRVRWAAVHIKTMKLRAPIKAKMFFRQQK
jgi:hypothetical protein